MDGLKWHLRKTNQKYRCRFLTECTSKWEVILEIHRSSRKKLVDNLAAFLACHRHPRGSLLHCRRCGWQTTQDTDNRAQCVGHLAKLSQSRWCQCQMTGCSARRSQSHQSFASRRDFFGFTVSGRGSCNVWSVSGSMWRSMSMSISISSILNEVLLAQTVDQELPCEFAQETR